MNTKSYFLPTKFLVFLPPEQLAEAEHARSIPQGWYGADIGVNEVRLQFITHSREEPEPKPMTTWTKWFERRPVKDNVEFHVIMD